jgi:dihydrofolate reductase
VFVLTHHPRPPIEMEGGTTFTFADDGIESALEQSVKAADGQDVRIGGGASTVQQFLRARLIDELHVAIVPILLAGASGSSPTSATAWTATSASSWSARRRWPTSGWPASPPDASGPGLRTSS